MDHIEIKLERNAFLFPSPMIVLGTQKNDKINWISIAYAGIVDSQHVSCSLNKNHFSNKIIRDNGCASINIPSRHDMKKVDFIGLNSGNTIDKSGLYEPFYGNIKNCPMIKSYFLSMECTLTDTLDRGKSELFIFHPEHIYMCSDVKDNILNYPDVKKIDPLLFSWYGYYCLGEKIGIPWKEGLSFF